jgi:PhnB protein
MSAKTLTPYLTFSGQCDVAIEFYRQALGAQVEVLMRFHESPEPPPPGMLQPGFENKVMHATLRIGEATLMCSDGCDDKSQFGGFNLALAWATPEEARKAFDALSQGGQVTMPLCETFWSPCFGMVTDRFGVGWMITIPSAPPA